MLLLVACIISWWTLPETWDGLAFGQHSVAGLDRIAQLWRGSRPIGSRDSKDTAVSRSQCSSFAQVIKKQVPGVGWCHIDPRNLFLILSVENKQPWPHVIEDSLLHAESLIVFDAGNVKHFQIFEIWQGLNETVQSTV